MNIRAWVARDWRKLLSMLLLSGGGVAVTVITWRLITLVAERTPTDPWPLAYSLYGDQGLIALVLISLGWVIGKTQAKGEIAGAQFDLSGGEDTSGGNTVTASATISSTSSPPAPPTGDTQ